MIPGGFLARAKGGAIGAVFCVCAAVLPGCKNGMQGLVDELDAMLALQKPPEPGSDLFNASEMLSDKYLVSKDATLCLSAPQASYYNWQIYKMVKEERTYEGYSFVETHYEDLKIGNYVLASSKSFILYVPDVDEMTAGTYRLILTVKDNVGNVYIDSCALIIYEPCYDLGDYNLPA